MSLLEAILIQFSEQVMEEVGKYKYLDLILCKHRSMERDTLKDLCKEGKWWDS